MRPPIFSKGCAVEPFVVPWSSDLSVTANNFDFSGKDVLVVGASRGGIGSAIAAAFQDARARVAITGVEAAPVEADQQRFPYTRLDVTNATSINSLTEATSRLDVLVNCAGISARGEEMNPATFERVVEVNLHGTFRMSQAFLRQLKDSRGCIVNVASMYSTFGSPKVPAYGASKAGVQQLTKSLAIAWAEFGIRVNAVAPGFVVTRQTERGRADPAHVAAVNSRTPLGRWGEPSDLAGPVLFLASPAAAFITGTTLLVDGGYSAV